MERPGFFMQLWEVRSPLCGATGLSLEAVSYTHLDVYKRQAYTYPMEDVVGYFDPSPEAYEANLEEARKLLEGAGYQFDESGMLSADTPISMTYLTNDSEGNVKIGESIQQDFAAIGINVTVETREWSVFLDERKQGKFDFCREGWLADYNDPINMLEMWETESGNNDMQFGR